MAGAFSQVKVFDALANFDPNGREFEIEIEFFCLLIWFCALVGAEEYDYGFWICHYVCHHVDRVDHNCRVDCAQVNATVAVCFVGCMA